MSGGVARSAISQWMLILPIIICIQSTISAFYIFYKIRIEMRHPLVYNIYKYNAMSIYAGLSAVFPGFLDTGYICLYARVCFSFILCRTPRAAIIFTHRHDYTIRRPRARLKGEDSLNEQGYGHRPWDRVGPGLRQGQGDSAQGAVRRRHR